MSTPSEVESAIAKIVAEVLSTPVENVGLDTDLRKLGIESFQVLRAIARIEEHFDVEVPDAAVFNMSTVAEMANVVRGLMAAPQGASQPKTV
jgi:acyl carrier protein